MRHFIGAVVRNALFFAVLTLITSPGCAEEALKPLVADLEPIMPDEPVEVTYNERYSVTSALESLSSIRAALISFTQLTEMSKKRLGARKLNSVGNTAWEIQNMGFPNWSSSIEGALYKSDFEIKRLEYELALERQMSGKINPEAVEKRKTALDAAEKRFKKFWSSASIAE